MSVRTTWGRRRCSTACTRARSVSAASSGRTGTSSAAITAPVSIPSSTRIHRCGGLRDTGREHVLDRVCAREGRKRGGVRVDDAAAVVLEERRPEQVHVSGADHEVDAAARKPIGERDVALLARAEVGGVEHRRLMPARWARSSARTPALLDATATTGRCASMSAWRFVPSPETRIPITRARCSRPLDPADHGLAAGIGDDGTEADPEVEHASQLLLLDVTGTSQSKTGGRFHAPSRCPHAARRGRRGRDWPRFRLPSRARTVRPSSRRTWSR